MAEAPRNMKLRNYAYLGWNISVIFHKTNARNRNACIFPFVKIQLRVIFFPPMRWMCEASMRKERPGVEEGLWAVTEPLWRGRHSVGDLPLILLMVCGITKAMICLVPSLSSVSCPATPWLLLGCPLLRADFHTLHQPVFKTRCVWSCPSHRGFAQAAHSAYNALSSHLTSKLLLILRMSAWNSLAQTSLSRFPWFSQIPST